MDPLYRTHQLHHIKFGCHRPPKHNITRLDICSTALPQAGTVRQVDSTVQERATVHIYSLEKQALKLLTDICITQVSMMHYVWRVVNFVFESVPGKEINHVKIRVYLF